MRYSFIQGRLIINFRLLLLGLLVSAPAFAWLALIDLPLQKCQSKLKFQVFLPAIREAYCHEKVPL